MKMSVQEALDQVFNDLDAMSPEQFRAEMEKHKDGDIAVAMRELSAFGAFLAIKEAGLCKDMVGVVDGQA